MNNYDSQKIIHNFFSILKSKSIFEKVLIIIWSLMPFIMMISKSLTDFLIVIIGISFLFFSVIKSSWSWINKSWIKLSILFFVFANVSACFSLLVETSLSNGLSWIRFPLFAAAVAIWLIKEKEVFYFTLLINFLSVIFIFILMGLETILTNHHVFEWPFRNPLNGPFIHRIGILFFSAAFFILFSKLKHKTKALFFVLISIFFSLLSGHRTGSFSFVIIIFILTFWPSFKFGRAMMISLLFSFLLVLFFTFNVQALERYILGIYNFSESAFLQYLGLWKTGIFVFFENPIIGIGPTNVQNYLSDNIITNYDPFKNNEHPHNHYIQAFAETGLIGGILYILLFLRIIVDSYKNTKNQINEIDDLISKSVFISSICIFWPFANNYDLFGQQQNSYLWYVISIILVSHGLNKKNLKYYN